MKNIYIKLVVLVLGMSLTTLFFSCRKNPTAPPIKGFTMGSSITIQRLRDTFALVGPGALKINSNTILTAVVTADETSGQLYKQVYVRDYSGTFTFPGNNNKHYAAISLHFLNSTGGSLYQGDSIAINLNGAWLALSSGGSLEIDSIMTSNFPVVHRIQSGLNPQPLVATIPQIYTYTTVPGLAAKQFVYDAQLVQINNIEFIQPEVGTTFATAQSYSVNVSSTPPVNVNKYVTDFTNTIVAYNSGYSNFAGQTIPSNSGNMVAIASLYGTMQLNIRSFQDMNFNAPYMPVIYDTITQCFDAISHPFIHTGLSKNSNCNNMAGWKTFDLQGNLFWEGVQYGVYPNYGYVPSVSNYHTTTNKNDIWLVSPPIVDATTEGGLHTKYMDFSLANAYQGSTSVNVLSILVTRNFNGRDIIPSDWQDISSAANAPFNYIFRGNGLGVFWYAHNQTLFPYNKTLPHKVPIDLNGTSSTFYVAFRYQSTATNQDSTGVTYYLGSLYLKNN